MSKARDLVWYLVDRPQVCGRVRHRRVAIVEPPVVRCRLARVLERVQGGEEVVRMPGVVPGDRGLAHRPDWRLGAAVPGRPPVTKDEISRVVRPAHSVRRCGALGDPCACEAREVLGEQIDRGDHVKRRGEGEGAPNEAFTRRAVERVMAIRQVAIEEKRNAAPAATLRVGHGGQRALVRRIGRGVIAGCVGRVPGEGIAPARTRPALALRNGAGTRALGGIDEVSNALSDEP